MKRFILPLIILFLFFSFTGCQVNHNNVELNEGTYMMTGEYEDGLRPYVGLSMEDNTFGMGAGTLVSFQIQGSFEINESKLVATSQNGTFIFKIKDSNTLILIDTENNEYLPLPENSVFVLTENN